jgi:8-oxo-dGTP pyrophosphatase MutT (NUDIX family)
MIPTIFVVLVVVPSEGRYLVVEERDGAWYLPAGKVEPGESLTAAAVRETAEEAGVAIGIRGVIGLDHEWRDGRCLMRFAFLGYLAHPTTPKSRPDEHSLGARWVRKAELGAMRLRHHEVVTWIDKYESGIVPLPCSAYEWFGP